MEVLKQQIIGYAVKAGFLLSGEEVSYDKPTKPAKNSVLLKNIKETQLKFLMEVEKRRLYKLVKGLRTILLHFNYASKVDPKKQTKGKLTNDISRSVSLL